MTSGMQRYKRKTIHKSSPTYAWQMGFKNQEDLCNKDSIFLCALVHCGLTWDRFALMKFAITV